MKKPLFTVSADWHLTPQNLEMKRELVQQIVRYNKGNKIDCHICCGDIFNVRKSQELSTLLGFQSILETFNEEQIILRAIPGNHDKVSYISEESYLDVYEQDQYFQLYRDVRVSSKLDEAGRVEVFYLPYFDEEKLYGEYLQKVVRLAGETENQELKRVLITHIAIDGVKNNDYATVSNSLKKELFDVFDL